MCARTVFAVLAIVVMGFCRVATATVVYDHFDEASGVPDSSLWALQGNIAVAGSSVTLTAPGAHGWSQMHSQAPFDTRTTSFEYKLTSYTAPEDGVYLGVITDDGLGMGTWVECRSGVWQMEIGDSLHDVRGPAFAAPALGDILAITRSGNVFTATDNGVPVATQTITGSMDNLVRLWLGASYDVTGGAVLSVDYAGTSTIPEPSALVLLSAGLISLLAYAWRKRR